MSSAFLVHVTQKEACIERAVFASFTDASATNVVAMRPSGLDIFCLVAGVGEQSSKLVLETSIKLHGVVKDVAVIRFSGSDKDSLIVSFASAKCTICEWNSETGEIQTVSMHYFETDAIKMGFTRFHLPPKLSVDPANRCAAMIALDRHIAIIGVAQEQQAGDAISAFFELAQARKRAKTQASWLIPISDIASSKTTQLIDMAFMHDYFQPTLLVLTEDRPTWPGRAAVVWNTRTVSAVSLDVQNRKWSTIWTVPGLSNDVHSIWPVPSPVGGAVLLAANAIYYTNQTTRFAMAVNIHGTVNPPFPRMALWQSPNGIVLDAARLCFVGVTPRYASCLISDKRGLLYVMNLMVGGTSVDSMEISSIGASSVASNLAFHNGHVFLASRLGDSLLLKCEDAKLKPAAASEHATAAPSASKRPRSDNKEEDALFDQLFSSAADGTAADAADANGGDGGGAEEQDREDLREAAREAHAEASARQAKMVTTRVETAAHLSVAWSLAVADTVLSIPITSMVLLPSLDPASVSNAESLQGDSARHLLDLAVCSGKGKSGSLAIMQQSARPELFLTFPIGFVNAAWALYHSPDSPFHQYLVLCRRRSTTLLDCTQKELEDVHAADCAIVLDAPTVGVWSFAGPKGVAHSRMIQVTKNEIRLCAGPRQSVQVVDTRLPDSANSLVSSASFAGGLLVLLRFNGQMSCWRYDEQQDRLVAMAGIDERGEGDAQWASCYVYLHPAAAHSCWQVLNEDKLTLMTLLRQMREEGKPESEIAEMFGGSLEEVFGNEEARKDLVFVIASRLSGSVEMWLQEGETFRLVFWTMGLCKGEGLVTHEQRWQAGGDKHRGGAGKRAGAGSLYVQEICIYRTHERGLPMLFCVTSQNDLFVYKSIHTDADKNVLSLRFRRMPLDFVSRAYKDVSVATHSVFEVDRDENKGKGDEEGMTVEGEEKQDALPYSRQLIVFNNLSGRRGVFFRGLHRSGWCFFSAREFADAMVQHNIYGEGTGLLAFTPFHYQSCRRGFITISADGKLRIAQLRLGSAPGCNGEVDGGWIVRKTSVRTEEDLQEGYDVTPMNIDYHPPSQHLVVGSLCTREKDVAPGPRDSPVGLRLPVVEERWRLSLYRAGSLKMSASLWLEDGEQILAMRVLSLCRGDDKKDRINHQAFGTQNLPRKM